LNTRPSSSSAAVPDNPARPGASRWASTTIRRLEKPVRVAITVAPERLTVNAERSLASSGAASSFAIFSASAASPASSISCSASNAREPSNTSGARVERPGSGRSSSANAARNSATSAGRKAVR
jgi:hypothetical protein